MSTDQNKTGISGIDQNNNKPIKPEAEKPNNVLNLANRNPQINTNIEQPKTNPVPPATDDADDKAKEAEKKARVDYRLRSLRGEPMTDEDKKMFLKDTYGGRDWDEILKMYGMDHYLTKKENTLEKEENETNPPQKVLPENNTNSDGKQLGETKMFKNSKILSGLFKVLSEEPEKEETIVVISDSDMNNPRLRYSKMLVNAIYDYETFLEDIKNMPDLDDLYETVSSHLKDDTIEYKNSLSKLSSKEVEEVEKTFKDLRKVLKTNDNEIDLSNELTKDELKKLNKEKEIDKKNEISEEKHNSDNVSSFIKKYMDI